MATLFEYIFKTNMELPYDYSLSHHQLLFNFIIVTCWHKYVNSFYKNKQNSTFIELLIY